MVMLLGKKVGMTQVYDESGNLLPVTVIQAGPCVVMQVKTTKSDGYNAVQCGFDDVKPARQKNPEIAHAQKAKTAPKKFMREVRLPDDAEQQYEIGDTITVSIFAEEKFIDVTGTSKGKGFAGVMKRHGFAGFMATHGVHESKRGPGSIGQSADPAKVFKGMRMPGQMGDETVTIQNLRIVDVRESQNLIMLKGPVPGGKNGLLVLHHAIKKEAPALRQTEPEEVEPDPGPAENGIEGEAPSEETVAAAPEVDETTETAADTSGEEAPEAQVPEAEAASDPESAPEPEPASEPAPEPDPASEPEPEPEPAEDSDEDSKDS